MKLKEALKNRFYKRCPKSVNWRKYHLKPDIAFLMVRKVDEQPDSQVRVTDRAFFNTTVENVCVNIVLFYFCSVAFTAWGCTVCVWNDISQYLYIITTTSPIWSIKSERLASDEVLHSVRSCESLAQDCINCVEYLRSSTAYDQVTPLLNGRSQL